MKRIWLWLALLAAAARHQAHGAVAQVAGVAGMAAGLPWQTIVAGETPDLRAMLSRIAARLWAGTAAHEMDAQDLDAQVERLAAISPHLLVDIGIDPVTLEMLDPEAIPQPAPAVPDTSPAAVVPAREDRRPIRLRPAHRSLPVGLAPA